MKLREKIKRTDDYTLRTIFRYLRKQNVIMDSKDGSFVFTGIMSKKALASLRASKIL